MRGLRGEGRWEHPALGYDSIRRYLTALRPVLTQWIGQGVAARQGNPARAVHRGLRSLFGALKQERMIFRDPSRGLTHGAAEILPQVVPSDLLAGLLDHADGALQRLIIAFVAIHALPGHEITRLLTTDLDLAAGHQIVRRGRQRHTLYLEETTHQPCGRADAVGSGNGSRCVRGFRECRGRARVVCSSVSPRVSVWGWQTSLFDYEGGST